MQLSREAIEAFKAIYQDEYGIALSDAEAQDMGQRLLVLFQILARHSYTLSIDGFLDPDTMREKVS